MKRSLPILIALILCVVLCSCKSKDATAADDMILAIGEVTLDSEQDIIQAENAVNALEDKDYKQLEYLEELEKARTTYDDLVDRDDANHIIESINEIKDNVTLDSEKKIQSVRKAYEKCTDGAKKYVIPLLLPKDFATPATTLSKSDSLIPEGGDISMIFFKCSVSFPLITI